MTTSAPELTLQIVIIRAANLTQTLWKNHGGTTTEIARGGADSASSSFDWRLSFAEVKTSGPFSEFPGCDRWLVVWQGDGFQLGETALLPYQPFHFSGDEAVSATLLGSPVVDLGLIYKREKFIATMRAITSADALGDRGEINFIFVCNGELFADGESLKPKDTLRWTSQAAPRLSAKHLRAIFVSLSEI